jgi:hypothetical protein
MAHFVDSLIPTMKFAPSECQIDVRLRVKKLEVLACMSKLSAAGFQCRVATTPEGDVCDLHAWQGMDPLVLLYNSSQ